MEGFLSEVADGLFKCYGTDISNVRIVFPSKRARLFFDLSLKSRIVEPIWQPEYLAIDDMVQELSGLRLADELLLLTSLYKVYSRWHDESFDKFYGFGAMILADFDTIDKYMVDAHQLYTNISELKDIETSFADYQDTDRELIMNFWLTFKNSSKSQAREQSEFLRIWQSLGAIYVAFTDELRAKGLAYSGMQYRAVAEWLKVLGSENGALGVEPQGGKVVDISPDDVSNSPDDIFASPGGISYSSDDTVASISDTSHSPAATDFGDSATDSTLGKSVDDERFTELLSKDYCFVGFNALSGSEKIILDYFKERGKALFYWDYDLFYTKVGNQAGRFIMRNKAQFSGENTSHNNFEKPKQINVISTPSDIMQCKALYRELQDIYTQQGFVDKETAVVLTDEKLLIPVLHSIPESVEKVNITMGYPLMGTVPYMLVERLLELQNRASGGEFYHSTVVSLLSHPYIQSRCLMPLRQQIATSGSIYVSEQFIAEFGNDGSRACKEECKSEESAIYARLQTIFRATNSIDELSQYLVQVLESFYDLAQGVYSDENEHRERREFLFIIIDTVAKLCNSIRECDIVIPLGVYISLLRQRLQSVKIPYRGEPLGGLQIMGILETRCLDFKNIIFLSLTDDNFPGAISGNSYIPLNLRQGFGLPTISDHEAVYAYYFYRSISRCERLTALYCSSDQGLRSGEQSRYLYQLDFLSPHKLNARNVNLKVEPNLQQTISVAKTPEIIAKLEQKRYSPSALKNYLDCPLRFYFMNVAGIKSPEVEIEEGISKLEMGTLVHKTLEILYTPIITTANHQKNIAAITSQDIDVAIVSAASEVLGQKLQNLGGWNAMVHDVVRRYVGNVIDYDAHRSEEFRVEALEVSIFGKIVGVEIGGVIDRVDRLKNGDIRIVDYKTGRADSTVITSLDSLFDSKSGNRAALQTILYSLLHSQSERCDVQPSLYVCPKMGDDHYSPYFFVTDQAAQFSLTPKVVESLGEYVKYLFSSILDVDIPFAQTEHINKCEYCDFKTICRR